MVEANKFDFRPKDDQGRHHQIDPIRTNFRGYDDAELIEMMNLIDIKFEAKVASVSFKEFVKGAWDVIEPGRELKWNWHLDYMCEYMEAFSRREQISDKRMLNRLKIGRASCRERV